MAPFFRGSKRKNWGFICLSVWLILTGIVPLIDFRVMGYSTFMSILAIAAGILILMDR